MSSPAPALPAIAGRLLLNPGLDRQRPYCGAYQRILSAAKLERARAAIQQWPGYGPTPLVALPGLAKALGLAQVWYKDEAERFGLMSFKALGGPFAVYRALARLVSERTGNAEVSVPQLLSGAHRDLTKDVTVTCATDGNHGRAVAWGASLFGCRCVIYLHAQVSPGREAAIAHFGAEIVRTPGHYDDAVTQAADDAQRLGRIVISDTSYEGYMEIPKDVMQGYQLMVDEAIAAAPDPISQTFIQAGVGGVAAAVCSYFWERLGSQRPQVVVVEPSLADCCFQSAVAGQPTRAKGDLNTLMAGLACGYPSLLAWEILGPGADAFMTVDDGAAVDCMKLLAHGLRGDPPLVAGESAVAGLAGLIAAVQGGYGADLGLDRHSQVLLFGCEGATDPELYHKLVA